MKIYVVNMDSRTDRWAHVSKQLDNLGLKYERLSATVGKELSIEQQKLFNKRKFLLEQKKPVVLGEIGCAYSHRRIWQNIIDNDIDYALVLEDDVNLDVKLLDFLANEKNYNEFDMLNISSNEPYKLQGIEEVKLDENREALRPGFFESKNKWKEMEWRRKWRVYRIKEVMDSMYLCECDPAPALTSGYIISKKGAKNLLATSEEMFYPVDYTWRLSSGMLVEGFLSQPLVVQALNETDIHGRSNNFQLSFIDRIVRFFVKSRKIRRKIDLFRLYGFKSIL